MGTLQDPLVRHVMQEVREDILACATSGKWRFACRRCPTRRVKQTKHLAGAHEGIFSMERSGVRTFERFQLFCPSVTLGM